MSEITGRADVRVDGELIATEVGATLNVGGANRNSERHGGHTYYVEEEVAPTVELTVLHTADTDMVALAAITNATVQFTCNTGQQYVLRNSFVTETPALDAATGKVPLKLDAESCDLVS